VLPHSPFGLLEEGGLYTRSVKLWLAGFAFAAAACARPAAPTAPPAPVDVLDYLLGDASTWPRVGSQSQNQIADVAGREVCWVKYANPRTFECWRWGDEYVYHVVDHAIDGNTGESYSFEDGRWLPRYLDGEWSLDVTTSITWFDAACRINATRSGPARYRQHAWLAGRRDAGGDLGVRDLLLLEYAPQDPTGGPGAPELFYFAKDAGWYAWERGASRVLFNRIGGPQPSVAREIACSRAVTVPFLRTPF
jgi:hypothetical protein